MFKLNIFLLRFFRDMVEHSAFESIRLQMFYEISVFETLAKIYRKKFMLESLFNKLHMYFPMMYVKLSRTTIFQSPLKIKQRLCMNKIGKYDNVDSRTSLHWSFTRQFSELIYHFFSRLKARILDELKS